MNGNDVGRNAYSNKARTKAFFFIKAMKIILILDYSNCGGCIYASGIRLYTFYTQLRCEVGVGSIGGKLLMKSSARVSRLNQTVESSIPLNGASH
jgi:hypothetical protein